MGLFSSLFKTNFELLPKSIQFGRFSDAHKDEEQYNARDRSMEAYKNSAYVESYTWFFKYLSQGDQSNVQYEFIESDLHFSIYQGSKIIKGIANNTHVKAEATIALTQNMHIGFLRRLLEENYQLKYFRFALDDDMNITGTFVSSSLDANPYKLYYGLKELATYADSRDDVLVVEFDELLPINNVHIKELSANEKHVKYQYLQTSISEVLSIIDQTRLDKGLHPGALSYVLLDLAYRLDYLIKPEGLTMKAIGEIHDVYLDTSIKSPDEKNQRITYILNRIKACSKEDFDKELYEVISTFGSRKSSSNASVIDFIRKEMNNMSWYLHNGYDDFALAVPSYVVGYSLYNFKMAKPMRAFLHLYFCVSQFKYFNDLDLVMNLTKNGQPKKKQIIYEMKSIANKYKTDFPLLSIDFDTIDFSSLLSFAKTYLNTISKLNFQRSDNR